MKIGSIDIDKPIALAPMEDITDAAYRMICKQLGADLVYTEFTASEALIRDVPSAFEKIKVYDEERPVAIQLFGGKEESMEEAARIAESFGPDFIDINCGCWVKNVVARNEGAGLLKDIGKFERIVKSTVRGTSLPVTVKTRLGWDINSICILDVARMVEVAGAKALAVHCRVRAQGHSGEADWKWLEKIKKVISIPLIGNGDLDDPEDAKRMFETGCDGVMVGRGAIGNPWIFQQAKYFIRHGKYMPEPELEERIKICLEHLSINLKRRGVPSGIFNFRKYYAGYFKGITNAGRLRKELMTCEDFDSIKACMYRFLKQETLPFVSSY